MIKVKKDTVIKEIPNERLLADYISAGWEIVNEKRTFERENIQFDNKGKDFVK